MKAILVVVTALVVTAVVPISAADGAPDSDRGGAQAAPVEVTTPYGAAGWVPQSYAAAHPNYLATVQARAQLRVPVSGAAMTPNSHFGCNLSVCIDVAGSGLQVTHWYTTANGNRGCIKAFFDIHHAGTVRTIWGPLVCPSTPGDGVYYDYGTNPAGWYFNGDQLCNGWTKIAGLACASIHS
jgi:hypothetical protein